MIRFVLRWSLRLLGILVVLVALAFIFRDNLLRQWLVYRIQRLTGGEARLGGAHLSLGGQSLSLTNLQIFNSPEFGGAIWVSVPDFHVELDGEAARRGQFRLKLARVHVSEFNLVRNQHGETNVFAILSHVNDQATVTDAVIVAPPGLEFAGVETLDLTLGTARYLDLGQSRNNQQFHVAITNEILHNVRSPADFTPLVMRVVVREISAGMSRNSLLAPPVPVPASPPK